MKCDELEKWYAGQFSPSAVVYGANEVDAAIAELKAIRKVHIEAIESMGAGLQQDEEEIRHQKYRRCLAMAEACMHKRWRTDEGFDYARSTRHMNKWLELAEKFKPNKEADK